MLFCNHSGSSTDRCGNSCQYALYFVYTIHPVIEGKIGDYSCLSYSKWKYKGIQLKKHVYTWGRFFFLIQWTVMWFVWEMMTVLCDSEKCGQMLEYNDTSGGRME